MVVFAPKKDYTNTDPQLHITRSAVNDSDKPTSQHLQSVKAHFEAEQSKITNKIVCSLQFRGNLDREPQIGGDLWPYDDVTLPLVGGNITLLDRSSRCPTAITAHSYDMPPTAERPAASHITILE